jgi:multiple sugar transport system ATP-binding protein
MGRAIVRDPQVFLFDEPLSNLDAKLRVAMRAEIKDLHQRLKTTTIYVTHDQIEAMTMADKIVVMNAGNVEQFGAPLELYDRPANLFVAGFIGSPAMNLIHGRVEAGSFHAGSVTLPLPPGLAGGAPRAAIYGIRPEHLRLDPAGVAAQIQVIEPTGSETQVIMKLGDAVLHGDAKMIGAFRERITERPGETLHVAPELGLVHLFDEATGVRLN